VLTSETKRRLDACRDLLVGKLPLPTDQVELITLALIYKFMDDLDEESVAMGGKRSFFTGPLAPYRWRALLPQTVSGEERVALFSEGVEAIGNAKTGAHLPELFRDIFRNAFLKFRDGRILTLFLNEVNGFAYSHSEELGNAFEYLLQCMGTQGENGQFRTPRHIIDWIVACLDPQPTDKILDPACGTGGFLVSAYRHILQKHTSPGSKLPGDRLGHEQRQRLYANFTGYDITDLMVKLSKVNLFLHQFPSPAIHIYDSLSNDARWSEKADLILANPPFMTPKGGVTPHTKFRVPAKKAEVLFTDYIAEHLTPDGRAGIIVPNGIVATTQNAYVSLRRFLVEDSLVAVVSLPAGVFKPYSGVKTSILLLDKKLARRTDKILFLKIAADGFDLGDQRREIAANDLPEAERLVKAWLKGKLSEDFVSPLTWKFVEKRELLVQASLSLQAEVYFGEVIAAAPSERVKLGDVATMGNGGTPLTTNAAFWKGDIPWVSPKDMKSLVLTDTIDHVSAEAVESSATKLLPAETVLCVVRSGILQHTLPVAITSRPMCTNQDILAITPDASRLNPRFLLHLLRCRSAEILRDGIKTGVTVQSFHNGFFKSYEIPLPPLEEQRRIVAEIEGYQQVIDGARQILAAYQAPRSPSIPTGTIVTLGEHMPTFTARAQACIDTKKQHNSGVNRYLIECATSYVGWGSVDNRRSPSK
jgi:type I restriction enzyme M protein